MSDSGELENPQEDKDEEQLPWDSTNPEVRKYYDNNEQNKLLDKIIQREIEQIEKDQEKNSLKKRKGQFSDYYNFIFELTKRLKFRIKENKKNYKFRKQIE